MQKQIFYTYKFKSSRLKEFDYNIKLTLDDAKKYGEVIALFDSQILRSIRDIHKRHVDWNYIDDIEKEIVRIKKLDHSVENVKRIGVLNKEIEKMLFIPEYITIVMDHNSHYHYLYKNGLLLNGKRYIRFNSSAGQARTSTVVFVEENSAVELERIIDNGRDLTKPFVPSKLNAYRGLAGSSTKVVSEPRFCVVPDYYSDTKVKVNYVTETDWNSDDNIEVKEIIESFNRFDGQGLISYEQASKWAEELGLDYVPAQWCVRNSFLKGMLNTFPIHEFCEKVNNGNYRVRTSYKDENGNPLIVDLRDVDVIITESQFKLWDSFPSVEVYVENCRKNNLNWGVSLHSPKKDKDILKMNYQFIQTLNLNKTDIEKLCEKFVDWLTGVTHNNIYYTLLFLLGTNTDENFIEKYLKESDNHWIKSLIIRPELIKDKYFKRKIYNLIKKKIERGCLGDIIVDGNFQTLVSDPYAMMQHVCGLEVTGLLGESEYYSNYWNEKDIKLVDSMRAPLTYRSEHVLLNLKKTKDTEHWYRYNYTGIIVNIHGHETMNWAGSDFDYDIIATTSDPTVIKGVYKNELPVYYVPPKSKKKQITNDDLFKSDIFSFGSIIGSITNKSTSAYALLPLLDQDSDEYKTTLNRIQMCTKLQSAQIDKAKIGREVKGIPKIWVNYQKNNEDDTEQTKREKEFLNNILLDKHPYFFIYLYKDTRSKYKNYVKDYNVTSQQRFGMSLDELKSKKRKTKEEIEFIRKFKEYLPVIDSDSVMNNLCKYIESVDFSINQVLKTETDTDIYNLLMSEPKRVIDENKYSKIVEIYNKYKNVLHKLIPIAYENDSQKNDFDEQKERTINGQYETLKYHLIEVCSNEKELVDYLVYLLYVEQPTSNKEVLWSIFGDCLYSNIKNKTDKITIPVLDDNGDLEYLNKKYTIREVVL